MSKSKKSTNKQHLAARRSAEEAASIKTAAETRLESVSRLAAKIDGLLMQNANVEGKARTVDTALEQGLATVDLLEEIGREASRKINAVVKKMKTLRESFSAEIKLDGISDVGESVIALQRTMIADRDAEIAKLQARLRDLEIGFNNLRVERDTALERRTKSDPRVLKIVKKAMKLSGTVSEQDLKKVLDITLRSAADELREATIFNRELQLDDPAAPPVGETASE